MASKFHDNEMGRVDSSHLRSLISSGSLGDVKEFICKKNVSVNSTLVLQCDGGTISTSPLHVCLDMEMCPHNLVNYFLSAGADCNQQDSRGYAPLHYAVQHKNPHAAKTLLEAGAVVNMKTEPRVSSQQDGAFVCYPKRQRKTMMRERKLERSSYPLHLIFKTRGGFDNDKGSLLTSQSRIDLAKLLLSHGADCNLYDGRGYVPLHYAVKYNDIPLAEVLLNSGAEINLTHGGLNPLFLADNKSMLRFLLSRNNNLEGLCGQKRNIFSWCFQKRLYDITRYLVEDRPELLHVRNSSNDSPLTIAVGNYVRCFHHSVEVVSSDELKNIETNIHLMVEAGCDPRETLDSIKKQMRVTLSLNDTPKVRHLLSNMEYLASRPRSLFSLCCIRIRSILTVNVSSAVSTLPLPTTLKDKLTLSQWCPSAV